MKYSILIILLLPGMFTSRAQQYFNKRYTLHSTNTATTSIIPIGNGYICTSFSRDSSYLSDYGIHFSTLDSIGNITRDTAYLKPARSIQAWNNSLIACSPNHYLLATSIDQDASYYKYTLLVKFDSIGNVVFDTEYTKTFCPEYAFWYIEDMKPTGTGEWLVLSHIGCTDSSVYSLHQEDMVLTKLDSNFNVIWAKQFGDIHWDDGCKKIAIAHDGYVLLGWRNNSNQVGIGIHFQAEIIKTDTGGNQLWLWRSNIAKQTGPVFDILCTKDGGYVYCGLGNGYEKVTGPMGYIYQKGWIEKLDSDRNVVWNDTIGAMENDLPISALKELLDSTIVVAGAIYGGFNPGDTIGVGHTSACLVKYKPNGELIWRRKYTHFNDSLKGVIYDMKQTPDGGFVLCGESDDYNHYYGNTTQQAWVLKVDSNGCSSLTDPQCQADKVKEIAIETTVSAYPNPARDMVYFETRPLLPAARIVIEDILGRQLASKPITRQKESIDISALPQGVYIYHVYNKDIQLQAGKIIKY